MISRHHWHVLFPQYERQNFTHTVLSILILTYLDSRREVVVENEKKNILKYVHMLTTFCSPFVSTCTTRFNILKLCFLPTVCLCFV
jgi:prenyltransferase beta subunit